MPPPEHDDDLLLVQARTDGAAFAALYDRHARELAGWLARRAGPEAARELLAETWAEAWASRARYKPKRGSARNWLYGIARHRLLRYYRSNAVERRAQQRLGLSVDFDPLDDDIDARVDAQSRRAEIERLLGALSPAVREAVVLRAVEQLDHREIALRTGCSEQAARLRVSRGLRALRAAWKDADTNGQTPQGALTHDLA